RSARKCWIRTRSCSAEAGAFASAAARLTTRTSWARAPGPRACSPSLPPPPPRGRVGATSETPSTPSPAPLRGPPARPPPPPAARVEVLAGPQLQHHQGPEPIGVGARAAQVLTLEGLDRVGVEQAASPDALWRQELVHGRAQIVSEPLAERNHEPLLAMRQDLLRQDPRERGLEKPLQAPARHLVARRQAQALLDDPVVAEWCPYLERAGHAHPIGHGEEIVGKVGRQINAEGSVDGVVRTARREGALLVAVDGRREVRRQRRPRERRETRVVEEPRPANVAVGRRRVGIRGEAPRPVSEVAARC